MPGIIRRDSIKTCPHCGSRLPLKTQGEIKINKTAVCPKCGEIITDVRVF